MAAKPIAAAVLRPTGSASICFAGTPRSSLRTAADCSALVTTQKFLNGTIGASRATVSRNMVLFPMIFNSCFGVCMRLRGQKRVPRPPASSTAHVGMVFFAEEFLLTPLTDAPAATNLFYQPPDSPTPSPMHPYPPARTRAILANPSPASSHMFPAPLEATRLAPVHI